MVSSSIALYLDSLSLSLTEPGAYLFKLDRLTREPLECSLSLSLSTGFQAFLPSMFRCHVGAGVWNSGPNPWPVSPSTAGPWVPHSPSASNPTPLTLLRQGLSI